MSIDEHPSAPAALDDNPSGSRQFDNASSSVAVLRRYFAALERGDAATVATMLSDDASYWILPGTAVSATHDKAPYLQLFDKLLEAQSELLAF